jgi:hypothetical protein
MGWFRSNRHIGGGLALFALAIHFVLSFGHIHVRSVAGGFPLVAVASSAPTTPSDAPANPSSHPGFADPCTICANIHLAGSLLTVDWPSWPLPLATEPERLADRGDIERTPWLGTTSRARAPPLA